MEQSISIKIPVYEQQDLSVNSFGHSVTAPCHQYGPAVRPYYLIHFILKGKGEYITNNTSYQLAEGQGFLIEPDSQIMYISDREDPWTYIWVGFSGRFAHTLLSSLGLSQEQPIFRSSEKDRLLEYVSNMIRHNHGSIEDTYYIMGMLFLFLSTIASSNRDTLPPSDGNVYINQAITYIQNHITESFQVDDIAHYVGLNRTYLSTLFTNPAEIKTKSAGITFSLPATGTISTRLVVLFSFGSNDTITACFTCPSLSKTNSLTVV